MSAALGLYRLQQVDSQMDQIRARLKTIRETLENDIKLRTAMDALSAAETHHKETSSALKQSEADFEKQRIKIEQTEANLYSGNVHNPKELQDLQLDVASLKKHLGTLEERELEVMIQVEDAEKTLQSASENLQRVQASLKDQNIDLTSESDTLNKDLERLESERNAVTGNLEAQLIRVYDQLRQQKRGVAVTTISDDSCEACGTTFTASQQQNARLNSQMFYCPTCGRIIYAG
jgi:predicted  nucleic acid-binding Zn-ribbon protein